MTIDLDSPPSNFSTPLIAAVSGGSDSMALLRLLKDSGFSQVVVAHVDHGFRKESARDADFVKKNAEELGFAFELKTIDLKSLTEQEGGNLEATGRRERYAFFRELKEKYMAQYIVTAHHADDQVETVLMNIIRGSGLDGISGMKVIDGDLWRPLLKYSKQDLLGYCEERALSFVQDSTNDDLSYRRNFLRSEVVPKLKELNPNLLGTMQNNIQIWRQAADELMSRASQYLDTNQGLSNRYHLQPFLELGAAEQRGVVARVCLHRQPGECGLSNEPSFEQVQAVGSIAIADRCQC